jgi:hypothetical protein
MLARPRYKIQTCLQEGIHRVQPMAAQLINVMLTSSFR